MVKIVLVFYVITGASNPSDLVVIFLISGNGISVEGALLTEQDVNHPKPAKRARTSFTADQLQVEAPTWYNAMNKDSCGMVEG